MLVKVFLGVLVKVVSPHIFWGNKLLPPWIKAKTKKTKTFTTMAAIEVQQENSYRVSWLHQVERIGF